MGKEEKYYTAKFLELPGSCIYIAWATNDWIMDFGW